MCNSFDIFGAFLVEPELKFELQQSVFVKLDNCLLWCKSTSYCTISRFSVLRVPLLGLPSADHHFPNANGFLIWIPFSRSATSMSVTKASLNFHPNPDQCLNFDASLKYCTSLKYCCSCESKRKKAHCPTSFFSSFYPHLGKNSPRLCSCCLHLHRHCWAWEYERSYATHRCYSCSNCHYNGYFHACACCCLHAILLDCAGWHGTLRTSAWRACRECNRLEVPVFALGGTLPVIAFVIATTAVVAELVLLSSAMLMMVVAAVASIGWPVAPTLVGEKGILTRILFLHLAA